MSFTAPRLLRASRAIGINSARRTYTTEGGPPPPQRSNNSTWYSFVLTEFTEYTLTTTRMVITAALGIPAAYYLLQGNSSRGKAPSEVDQPATRKAPAGGASMSSKQEGLDNADSSNPYINEPGKSVKGEGETESAKLKGTVSPKRPAQ